MKRMTLIAAAAIVATAGVASQPLQLDRGIHLQVYHITGTTHGLAVGFGQHGAATGGDHGSVRGQGRSQRIGFAAAETGFTLASEDRRDVAAGSVGDAGIQIDERQAKALRQRMAHGALAGTHRADQDHMPAGKSGVAHCNMLAAGCTALTRQPRGCHSGHVRPDNREESPMSVAKVIELNASSTTSMEEAVKYGLKKCAESVKNIKGAWVNEIKVVTDEAGNVQEWRVNLRVSFVVK